MLAEEKSEEEGGGPGGGEKGRIVNDAVEL